MTVIDSDAHVIETERTWDFMLPSDSAYRPEIVTGEDGVDYWMIEGKNRGRARGPVAAKGIATSVNRGMEVDEGKRLMEDIPGRIAHMDELGVDTHVLYPTIFLRPLTRRPEAELALGEHTAEVTAELLRNTGDVSAANVLDDYFDAFNDSYAASRRHGKLEAPTAPMQRLLARR